jgi:plastocyanin
MRKVDRLLLKVQQAQRLDAMQVSVAFVEPSGDKWRAIVDLWDGVDYPNAKTQRLELELNTMEEAVAAVEEVKAAHAPTGVMVGAGDGVTFAFRGKHQPDSVTIIDDRPRA